MSFTRIVPAAVIDEIAAALPPTCRDHVVVIGSLAAGFHFAGQEQHPVQTKDIDCLLAPDTVAVEQAATLANALIAHGWYADPMQDAPGTTNTPVDQVPVLRLRPRPDHPWFIELLTWHDGRDERRLMPVETVQGRWAIAAFPYLALAAWHAVDRGGIRIARPEMLALANLLGHTELTDRRMGAAMGGRAIRRCCKDLGRVLALAYLTLRRDRTIEPWRAAWSEALQDVQPTRAVDLIGRCGDGLDALLASGDHLEEATHACHYGILAALAPTVTSATLEVAGQRLFQDVIEPLQRSTGGDARTR